MGAPALGSCCIRITREKYFTMHVCRQQRPRRRRSKERNSNLCLPRRQTTRAGSCLLRAMLLYCMVQSFPSPHGCVLQRML